MRGSRGVGTAVTGGGGGQDNFLPHGKAQSCKFPQEYWFGTFGKAQSYGFQVIIARFGYLV